MPNVMAAEPNIGGALCESCVIPLPVPRRKVWLTPAGAVPCSNAANVREPKGRNVNFAEGKFPSGARAQKMYIQCSSQGDSQTSCTVWLNWLASGERRVCSNAAKTRNPLKLAGMPQTTGPMSGDIAA